MSQDRVDQIEEVIYFLRKYWQKNPDFRLCQILGNRFPGDNYYIEDQAVLDYLVKLVNEVDD
jgi:uncharacterized protein YihD (DUF1040 family)